VAERLRRSKWQVQRDLKVLRQVGFPVEHEDRDFGKRFWKLSPRFLEREGCHQGSPAAQRTDVRLLGRFDLLHMITSAPRASAPPDADLPQSRCGTDAPASRKDKP